MDDQLQRAFDGLSLLRVADHFGIKLKEGVQKSPFRVDKKGQSFSVCRKGTYFKDHADEDVKGGVWAFVKLAAPEMPGREIRDLLVTLNGETPERLAPTKVKNEVRAKRGDLYKQRLQKCADVPKLEQAEPPKWSAAVEQKWSDGNQVLQYNEKTKQTLSASRGWEPQIIETMIAQNKTSLPMLPWTDNDRCWAWLVEKPEFKQNRLTLHPVGFHGRYKFKANGQVEKRWTFCPYIPNPLRADGTKKKLTDFQQNLLKQAVKLPAYPFVLGDPANEPKLLIITEGQFDAVSIAAAFGWLAPSASIPDGVILLGLRGVQSQAALLAGYGYWLKKHAPFIWYIGDGDKAGRQVDNRRPEELKAINQEPTFIDHLRGLGCTVSAELINQPGCKDFNDVYKAAKPSSEKMHTWASHVGAGELVRG